MTRRIYLDHHATTPTDPRVVEAMLPWFTERPGNASSPHLFGWEAREAIDRARGQIAAFLDVDPSGVVFTGSATESIHLALIGLCERRAARGRHLVTTAFEHPAVLETVRLLQARGFSSTIVEVGPDGLVDPRTIAAALRDDTVLCSVMAANNEVGTVQPLAEIAALCHERGVVLHSDACQAVGRVPLSVGASGVDLLTLSGHKMYGPKGIGALAIRRQRPRVSLEPQLVGGGQQEGLRSGTLPVPLVVGLGEACALASTLLATEAPRLLALRTRLLAAFTAALDDVQVNGDLERRLPGNLSVSFAGVEAEAILLALPGLGLSVGSACSASHAEPSHVLRALGLRDEAIHATLRFGLGRTNTEEEIDEAAAAVIGVVRHLRETSPVHRAVRSGG